MRCSLSLRAKLLAVLLPAITALVGLQVYAALHYRGYVDASRETAARAERATHAALDGQVHFKKQVQEWKNVLLRGHASGDYVKYRSQFEDEERATREAIGRLLELLDEGDEGREIALRFLASHRRLGVRYREALATFEAEPSRSDAAWSTDRLVRGIDREPTDLLDEVVLRVLASRDERLAGIEAGLAFTERKLVLLYGVTVVVLLLLIARVMNRAVLRPIARATRVAHRIATGDLTGEIEVHDRDETGQLLQALGTMQISLIRSRDAVDAQNEYLRVARDEALEAARVKAEFLANMSHELRTPLNGMLGMVQLLEETELDEEQSDYLELASTSGDQLHGLINDVLDFSKLEAGRADLDPEDFALRPMVEKLVGSLASRAYAQGVDVVVDIDPAVDGTVHGDRQRLAQALTNLVGNAIKFTSEGEVRVRVEPFGDGDAEGVPDVRFLVEDTGIGLAPEAQARIFEAFTQADGTTTRRFGGTGLGLTIARAVVGLMGGELRVESELGEGSTFWFTVPLRPEPDVVDPEELDGLVVGLGVYRASLRDGLRTVLERRGVEVVAVEETQTANAIAALGVDVLVVDGGAQEDALAVRTHLDAWNHLTREVPSIALCPRGTRRRERGRGKFPVTVVYKPLRQHDLIEAVGVAAGRGIPVA